MVSLEDFSILTNAIHEAALTPDRWTDVLDDVTAAFGAKLGGIVAGPTQQGPALIVASRADPAFVRSYADHYAGVDPIVPYAQRMPAGTVVTCQMVMPSTAMLRTEFYNDWARPQGIFGCLIAKFLPGDNAGVVALSMPAGGSDFTPQAVELLQALIPHLRVAVRTLRLLHGLTLERDGSCDALERLGQAAFFVDAAARVMHANGAGETLLRRADGLSAGTYGLQAATSLLTTRLRRLVARAAGCGGVVPLGGSLRLDRPSGRSPLVATISPLRRTGPESPRLPGPGAIVLVAMPAQPTLPGGTQALRDLFGLTPAEAAVAFAIAQGTGVKSAAAALGIARSTARTHLHRAFEKTGTQRQAQLAQLFGQVSPATLGGSD